MTSKGALRKSVVLLLVSLAAQACLPPQSAPTLPASTGARAVTPTASEQLCDALGLDRVEAIVGGAVSIITNSSSAQICAVRVASADGDYDINLRVEDTFPDLEAVKAAVPGGEETVVDGRDAYWGASLPVLWIQGSRLYAVQLIGSPLDEGDALALAEELGRLLVSSP